MVRINVCVGSSCYVKGAPLVIKAFQEEIERQKINDQVQVVELYGSFCNNRCSDGVIVSVDHQVFTRVTPADVANILDSCCNGE